MHQCNNEICDKIVEKTLAMNAYMTEILIGEGIISRNTDIMKHKRPDENPTSEIDAKTVNDMIEKILNQKLSNYDNQLKSHETEIKLIKDNVTKFGNDLDSVKRSVTTLQGDIKSVKNDINNIENKMDKNHSELKDLLISMMNKTK
jgi:chromosome segregation ATPase